MSSEGPDELAIIGLVQDRVKLLPTLSRRQSEVLRLISSGTTNSQISTRLGIARTTVENHVKDLKYKLGVDSRSLLAVIGYFLIISTASHEKTVSPWFPASSHVVDRHAERDRQSGLGTRT